MVPGAIQPPILPGEVLSSWLVRTAFAQGCDPLILTGVLWPEWRAWTQDVDRDPSASRLRVLSSISGASLNILEMTILRPIAEIVRGASIAEIAVWPWILVTGSRNRLRRGGMQFCPHCLSEGPEPYFRRDWRLAWHIGCVRHAGMLLDACPICAAPIEPHRAEVGRPDSFTRCAECNGDLASCAASRAPPSALTFQTMADAVVVERTGHFGEMILPAHQWFALTRHLVSIVRRAALGRHGGLVTLIAQLGADLDMLASPASGLALEFLPTLERASMLAAAATLLRAGPETFVEAAHRSGVAANALLDGRPPPPEFFVTGMASLTRRGRARQTPVSIEPAGVVAPISQVRVARRWARLRRKARISAVGVSRCASHTHGGFGPDRR